MRDPFQTAVVRASPLGERLRGDFAPVEGTDVVRLREERWEKWSETISRDDPEALLRRLSLAGIDPAKAKALLADDLVAVNGPGHRDWVELVKASLGAPEIPIAESSGNWGEFYQTFQSGARRWLAERVGELPGRLSDAALADLEEALRKRLEAIHGRVLDVEFAIARAGIPGLAAPTAAERGDFARKSLEDGSYFQSYPAAARLTGLVVEFWVEAVAEFLQRLEADAEELAACFGKSELGRVERVTASLSDPHRRGRTVLIATFTDDFKLVYKPRSVGMEVAWFKTTAWLNERECPIEWKSVCVLDCGTHGWMEFVSHESCDSDAEVALFFERAGGMLALLYALAGADMHLENLIAHGAHPVPVDLEALMMADRGDPGNDENKDAAIEAGSHILRHSVLTAGLLPSWVSMEKGRAFNTGGLGATELRDPPAPHMPMVGGKAVPSHPFRPSIVRGFEATYRFLLQQQNALLSDGGPLRDFQNLPIRFINRATTVYGRALGRATGPLPLESGFARSMEFEIFYKSALHVPPSAAREVMEVAKAEILAMEQGDVPFFQGRSDSRDLFIPETGATLAAFFGEDGFSISRERMRNFSEEDLALQKQLIHLSFDMAGDAPAPVGEHTGSSASRQPGFRDEAFALARVVREQAIRSGEDVTWIAPQLLPGTERFNLTLIGGSIYDGTPGVMLFLLAMGSRLGDEASGKLGRRVFESFRRSLRKSAVVALLRQQSVGLYGLGGQIYAMLLGAELSGRPEMLELAVELGGMITEASLSRRKDHDILHGPAGAIPALLALHAATSDEAWLRKAVACGDWLLSTSEETVTGQRSWKTFGKFLAGYSHGAAGCAASLRRLDAASGEGRFRKAAAEAIAYENFLFDSDQGNWKDLRFDGGFISSWCHGAPGILMGRLLGGAAARDGDVARALEGTLRSGLGPTDQCCCGNAGKADILLSAGRELREDRIGDSARDLMQQTIARSQSVGGYRCYGKLPHTVRGPGFFQGLSGIGYTLLRMEFSELPSVLAMSASLGPLCPPERAV